uniref:Uncharacterized protein n=1 Tax=Oryzias latipes TaxID=8090 RepID=A0A3P9KYP7_ORYLA
MKWNKRILKSSRKTVCHLNLCVSDSCEGSFYICPNEDKRNGIKKRKAHKTRHKESWNMRHEAQPRSCVFNSATCEDRKGTENSTYKRGCCC